MEKPSFRTVIGADIGGTHVRFALITEQGKIIWQIKELRIRGASPQLIIDQWVSIAKELESRAQSLNLRVSALGIGIAGKIDVDEGRVIFSPNLRELNGFDVRAALGSALSYPIALDNDANVFGRGELWLGKGSKYRDWLGVTLGTGVGGCLILDGRVWTGSREIGFAGEIGHTTIYPNGRACMCGKQGCLEAYSSEGGLLRHIASCGFEKYRAIPDLSARKIYEMALSGDTTALKLYEEFGTALGIAIANAFSLLGIRCAIIGGGVSDAWDVFCEAMFRATAEHCSMLAPEDMVIEKSNLGDSAALYGAAKLALDMIENPPSTTNR